MQIGRALTLPGVFEFWEVVSQARFRGKAKSIGRNSMGTHIAARRRNYKDAADPEASNVGPCGDDSLWCHRD